MILNYYLKMIEVFCNWFEGTWENKIQAFSYPSKYAMVRLIHKKVPGTESMFYGEQAYNYALTAPYRQFVIEAKFDGKAIRVRNYDFDKKSFLGFTNLESIPEGLTHKKMCDTILTFDGKAFHGSIEGCRCHVEWQNQVTYVKNSVFLSENEYHVVDKGYLLGTDTQVWGGKYGPFKFTKTATLAQLDRATVL